MSGRKCAAACLAASLVVGCGAAAPQPSERDQVDTALHSYLRAQAEGDGTTACGLLTAGAQNQLIGLVVSAAGRLIATRPSCSDAVGLVGSVAGAKVASALEHARVTQIQLGGSRATAQVADGAAFRPQRVTLVKTGGSWKIAGIPALHP
jgi:hypothetical protein